MCGTPSASRTTSTGAARPLACASPSIVGSDWRIHSHAAASATNTMRTMPFAVFPTHFTPSPLLHASPRARFGTRLRAWSSRGGHLFRGITTHLGEHEHSSLILLAQRIGSGLLVSQHLGSEGLAVVEGAIAQACGVRVVVPRALVARHAVNDLEADRGMLDAYRHELRKVSRRDPEG